jgi:hypothetical protein
MVVKFLCLTWLCNFRVSHGCEISVSHIAMEFQCLTWLWNSSVWHDCGEILKSHSHVRHWNSTAIWDTGISQPCETLKYHSHVWHWNSTAIVRHWNSKINSDTVILQSCQILEFHNHVRPWNSTIMSDTGIPQSCQTLEFHSDVRHWYFTHHSAQTNTYTINKTWSLLQTTGGKTNRISFSCRNLYEHYETEIRA